MPLGNEKNQTALITCLMFLWLCGLPLVILHGVMVIMTYIQGYDDLAKLFLWHSILLLMPTIAAKLGLSKQTPYFDTTMKTLFYIAAWPTIALGASSVACMMNGTPFLLSFYQCLAALTTTTTALIPNTQANAMPMMWLGLLTWLGGLLTVTGTVSFAIEWMKQASRDPEITLQRHSIMRKNKASIFANLLIKEKRLLLHITLAYFGLTIGAWLLLYPASTSTNQLTLLVFNAVSTNGFFGFAGTDIMPKGGFSLFVLLGVVMMSSIQPLVLFKADSPFRKMSTHNHMLIWAIPMIALVIVAFAMFQDNKPLMAAFVATVGLFSTTGLTLSPSDIASIPIALVLILLGLGGYAYSSTGGIKIDRIFVLLTHVRRILLQSIYPHAYVGHSRNTDQATRLNYINVRTLFVLFIFVWLVMAVWFSLQLPFAAALTLSMTALANAGDVYQVLAIENHWPSLDVLLFVFGPSLSVLMVLGRLELILALVILVRVIMKLRAY